MRKRTIALALIILFVLTGIAMGASTSWDSVRAIVYGYRNVCALVEASLAFVNLYDLSMGNKLHVTSGLNGRDFDELALKLSSGSGGYASFLEVWTKRGGMWYKAMEYSYNDGNSGEIVIEPYMFDTSYSAGSIHKIVFQHASGTKEMTVYSIHNPAVNYTERSIGTAEQASGYVTLYFTAHLNQSFAGASTNDAYLFGAKISTTAPHYATAKQGIFDQGDTYDFTLYGVSNPLNAGLFNSSDPDGFVNDNESGGGSYPPAADIDAANLPNAAQVNAFSVAFQGTAPPDFI